MDFKRITEKQAKTHGISTRNDLMPNGEKRFRLISDDGTRYIRTEAPDIGCWQNSHLHSTLHEFYAVQKGWVILAEFIDGKAEYKRMNASETFICKPSVPHNIFTSANTVHHTVKYGDTTNNDWIAFEKLDDLIKNYDMANCFD